MVNSVMLPVLTLPTSFSHSVVQKLLLLQLSDTEP
jgi:hypothetical protein